MNIYLFGTPDYDESQLLIKEVPNTWKKINWCYSNQRTDGVKWLVYKKPQSANCPSWKSVKKK